MTLGKYVSLKVNILLRTEVRLFNPSAAVPPTLVINLPSPKGMQEVILFRVEVSKNDSKFAVLSHDYF